MQFSPPALFLSCRKIQQVSADEVSNANLHKDLLVTGNLTSMVKYSFVFVIMFLIGLLSLFSGDLAISVVPGWHTTIYPPWFVFTVCQVLWLGVAAFAYFFIDRKRIAIRRKVFLLHCMLSLSFFTGNVYVYVEDYVMARALAVTLLVLFGIGQVIFVFGILTARKSALTVAE